MKGQFIKLKIEYMVNFGQLNHGWINSTDEFYPNNKTKGWYASFYGGVGIGI